jgi:two-component system chemotaxis response regulator CheY
MKVLVVDDDVAYLQLLDLILRGKQHEVVEARDGETAWEIMLRDPVSFVITDWMLPEMEGIELIRRIREKNFPNYIYIILLTARHDKGDVVDGLTSGADDYLTKPFDLNELNARIDIGERILNLETRLRETMDQLYVMATRDSLTGLLNRRALYDTAKSELTRATREGNPVSMVMMDLDHFKIINDKFGHLVGDQALCQVANALNENKRNYDKVARWGGEEFVLVLPGADHEEARQVAERLRAGVNNTQLELPDGDAIQLQASFGVACSCPEDNLSFDELVQRADIALYVAKKEGRNKVRIFNNPV